MSKCTGTKAGPPLVEVHLLTGPPLMCNLARHWQLYCSMGFQSLKLQLRLLSDSSRETLRTILNKLLQRIHLHTLGIYTRLTLCLFLEHYIWRLLIYTVLLEKAMNWMCFDASSLQGCTQSGIQHAVKHHQVFHSESHCITISLSTWKAWWETSQLCSNSTKKQKCPFHFSHWNS